ncbi:hypothetical protein C8Q72DRAFT_954546 [Fomitopsis betulina]|nr:hypothetical protein C8Q72DRAFT_954546 [Fomitopsis betulina]
MTRPSGDGLTHDSLSRFPQENPLLEGLTPSQAYAELKDAVKAYARGFEPFDRPLKTNRSVRDWWIKVQKEPGAQVLRALAIKLYSVVPNSMHDERAMSMLTYLNGARRASQDVHSVRDQIHIRQWHRMTHKDAKARMTPVVKWRELKCQNRRELGQPSKAPAQDDLHPAADSDSDDESETVAELRSLLGDLSLSEQRRFVADESIDVTSQFLRDVLSDSQSPGEQALSTRQAAATHRRTMEDVPSHELNWDHW